METSPNKISSSDDQSISRNSPISSYDPYQPIQVSLVDESNLWSQFSKMGTEMIINKTGSSLWNHFENTGERTTNNVEGWHSKINKRAHSHHLNIYNFVLLLRQEQRENEAVMRMMDAGHQFPAGKPKQMFPGVKLHFENLNPYKFYKVYMELAPVDGMRYRYDRNSWSPRGTIETSITSSFVEHPQSPAEGFKWMNSNKPVDFSVRLTNSLENSNDETVYLRSMFKYMIIIHVEEGSDLTYRNPQLTRSFPLIKTTFIAVTTYQNHQVKDLKTASNIHAKGVRHKKLKQFAEMYHSMKENLTKRSMAETTDTSKRPRMESDFSPTSIQRLFSKKDNSEIGKISPPSSLLPNLNNFYPKPIEFVNRNDPFTTPVLPHYRRFETPILSERIPVTAPLTIHCPSPYAPLDHPPYYAPLLLPMHHQNFPIIPPYSSLSFYSNKWPLYQSSYLPSTCGSASLNICPSCRDGFQSCVTCAASRNTQMLDHAAPSSTTETEVSSSFENSVSFPSSSRSSDSIVSSISAENPSNGSSASDSISSSVVEALNQVYS